MEYVTYHLCNTYEMVEFNDNWDVNTKSRAWQLVLARHSSFTQTGNMTAY